MAQHFPAAIVDRPVNQPLASSLLCTVDLGMSKFVLARLLHCVPKSDLQDGIPGKYDCTQIFFGCPNVSLSTLATILSIR